MSVRLGAVATILVAAAGVAVYLGSWSQPHRPLMTALAGVFVLGAVLLLVVPLRRMIEGAAGNVFFVVWSAISTSGIAFFYWLDGGGRSPIAYGLVLALTFAGFQYLVRGATAVAALVVGGYLLAAPASCGLASFPADGATADDLFSRADARVYAEKAARTATASRAPAPPSPTRPAR